MKVSAFFLVLAFWSSFYGGVKDKPKHGPLLLIDTTNASFGFVRNRGFVEKTFPLSNVGDSVLRITLVQPSCGCTIASLPDSTLPPGTQTVLTIKLNADRKTGGFEKSVFIASNSRDTNLTYFVFRGRFVSDSASSGGSLASQSE